MEIGIFKERLMWICAILIVGVVFMSLWFYELQKADVYDNYVKADAKQLSEAICLQRLALTQEEAAQFGEQAKYDFNNSVFYIEAVNADCANFIMLKINETENR